MTDDEIDALNEDYAIADHVSFCAGPGGLPTARIWNEAAACDVCLLGAHALSFRPTGERSVLFLSRASRFEVGAAIRGGVPVCWPWFGRHETDPDKPLHGLARTRLWEVIETSAEGEDVTELRLALRDDEETRREWPHAFELELAVRVSAQLRIELLTRNPGAEPFTITEALHHYFRVSDASQICIRGLEGTPYFDKADAAPDPKPQDGPVIIAAETDRVYNGTEADLHIDDPGWGRRIRIHKEGSRSTVVWNPWVDKSKAMPDFGDDEYPRMVCVETANALADAVVVAPGEEHRLAAEVSVEALGD